MFIMCCHSFVANYMCHARGSWVRPPTQSSKVWRSLAVKYFYSNLDIGQFLVLLCAFSTVCKVYIGFTSREVCKIAAVNPLSHQAAMPQLFYSVQKYVSALWSRRKIGLKISNLPVIGAHKVLTSSIQRPHEIPRASLHRLCCSYSAQEVAAACSQCAYDAHTTYIQCAHSAHTVFPRRS